MTTTKELTEKAADLKAIIDQYLPAPSKVRGICPDMDLIQNELMWGGIWSEPGLDLKLRSMAVITAQCVNGKDFGLRTQCRVGLTLGMSPQKIKGIFLELRFWVGIPPTVFALLMLQEVINEREEWKALDVPLEAPWLPTIEEKMTRGRELRRKDWGDQADQELASTIVHEMAPKAATMVDAYHYGEVWARSLLDAKERMVCILVALMSRGHMAQLKRQIAYALNVGFNKREIVETFVQAGWFRGWPYVEEALMQAKEVFAERGI